MRSILILTLLTVTAEGCSSACQAWYAEMVRRDTRRGVAKTALLIEQHTPVLSFGDGEATVGVGTGLQWGSTSGIVHPMTQGSRDGFQNHYIEALFVVDENDEVVASSMNTPQTASGLLNFALNGINATMLTPIAVCNQHGMFKGEAVALSASQISDSKDVCSPTCDSPLPIALYAEFNKENLVREITTGVTDQTSIRAHTPVIEQNGKDFKVTIGSGGQTIHPSNASPNPDVIHYIDSIFVMDVDEKEVIAFGYFTPAASLPTLSFRVGANPNNIRAYIHCNLHGMFPSVEMSITPDMRDTAATPDKYIGCSNCTSPPAFTSQIFNATTGLAKAGVNQKIAWFGNVAREVTEVSVSATGLANEGIKIYIGENMTSADSNQMCAQGTGGKVYPCIGVGKCVWVVADNATVNLYDITVVAKGMMTFTKNVDQPECVPATIASEALRMQYSAFNTMMQPSNPKHKPMLTIKNAEALVSIGEGTVMEGQPIHPMMAAHFIDTIYAVDQNDKVIASSSLIPNQGSPATMSFTIPAGTTHITPYSHCNIHGLYKGDTMALQMTPTMTTPCGYTSCGGKQDGESPLCMTAQTGCDNMLVEMNRRTPTNVPELKSLHTPSVSVHNNGKAMVIAASHPQTETVLVSRDPYAVHYIDYIGVKDQNGDVVAASIVLPQKEALLWFLIPNGTTTLTAFAHCNRHGTYEGEATTITPDQTSSMEWTSCSDMGMPDMCLDADTVTDSVCTNIAADMLARNTIEIPNEKHTPVIVVDTATRKGSVTIGVSGNYHPMVPSDDPNVVHFIETIWVSARDTTGTEYPFAVWSPSPGTNAASGLSYEFTVPSWALTVKAFSKCNIHGLFQSDEWVDPVPSMVKPGTVLPCEVGACMQESPAQLACDSYMAEMTRMGNMTSMGLKVYVSARPGGIANVVVLGMTNTSAPHVNTKDLFVKYIVAVDQNDNVLAMGVISPTETFASMEFTVQGGVTKVSGKAMMNTGMVVEGAWTTFDTPDNMLPRECIVAKCLLQKCTQSTDYGGGGDGDIDADAVDGDDTADTGDDAMDGDAGKPGTPMPTTLAPPSSSDDSSPSAVLIVVIVVGVLATVGALAFFFMKSSKPKVNPGQLDFLEQCELLDENQGEMHPTKTSVNDPTVSTLAE
eukprot:TRINITY_DN1251_c2_g2_i1.p1 TRINITY_DN1251_c2_g2~~TRINITY_DN1251_c2_g2_i1.p1  ORF type:complete len:1151 (+),score=248.42 TRINITY_DN1251_c2_g2_i1:23-3454(+)